MSFQMHRRILRNLTITRPIHRYGLNIAKNLHYAATKSFSTALSPTPDEKDRVPAIPIDFSTSSEIKGEESNVAFINLKEGQVLRAESGAMIFMTQGIEMDTKLAGASSAFSRFLTGQNVFLTDYRYTSGNGGNEGGTVALGTGFPSKIIRLNLADHPGQSLICQRGAFLASNPTVEIQTEFTKSLTAGFFGGQGFILQRLTGEGEVLVKAGGTLVKKELQEGETLRVTSGSIVAFESSCQYDVQMMPGIKNALFGGEGLFVTTLTGPGFVWLQGMPADRMIAEIARRVPSGGGIGMGIPIGMGGGGAGGGAESADGGAAVDGSGAAAAASPLGDESAAAASDAAIDADRQTTVASSGMPPDSESPEALFGDAAPKDSAAASSGSSSNNNDTSSDFSSPADTNTSSAFPPEEDNTTFSTTDDHSSFSSFEEENSQGFDDTFEDGFDAAGPADGELFNDTSSSSGVESGNSDGGNGLLGMLWDFISGNGDE